MTSWRNITGSLVALVTPMTEKGELDFAALRRLMDFHIREGTDGIVVVGTSGESPTVDRAEHLEIIRIAVEHCAGRLPVIAGTGANATKEAVDLHKEAHRLGADASLSVAPYYNKPTQQGMYEHFKAVAESAPLPLILYNIPGRTASDIQVDTVVRLADISTIVGIKEEISSMARVAELLQRVPAHFAIYSGDDAAALAVMLLGGKGAISVTANVAPRLMHQMCAAALAQDIAAARRFDAQLLGLHRNLFLETNPIPVKWAVARLGHIPGPWLRLPLTTLSERHHAAVETAMRQANVLSVKGS